MTPEDAATISRFAARIRRGKPVFLADDALRRMTRADNFEAAAQAMDVAAIALSKPGVSLRYSRVAFTGGLYTMLTVAGPVERPYVCAARDAAGLSHALVQGGRPAQQALLSTPEAQRALAEHGLTLEEAMERAPPPLWACVYLEPIGAPDPLLLGCLSALIGGAHGSAASAQTGAGSTDVD